MVSKAPAAQGRFGCPVDTSATHGAQANQHCLKHPAPHQGWLVLSQSQYPVPECTDHRDALPWIGWKKWHKNKLLERRHRLILTSNWLYSSWNKISYKWLVHVQYSLPATAQSQVQGQPLEPGWSRTGLGHWSLLQWNPEQISGHTQALWSGLDFLGMQKAVCDQGPFIIYQGHDVRQTACNFLTKWQMSR